MPDFVLSVYNEVKPGQGEDNFCYCFTHGMGMISAFDGCGGAGARRHQEYDDHSEAYMASRMCAGVFYDCFVDAFPFQGSADTFPPYYREQVQARCAEVLTSYAPPAQTTPLMKGSMVRTLPTTVASALIYKAEDKGHMVSAIWAGDSRVYVLTEDGLSQLTKDDCSVSDPFDNLYENGVLRNMICQGRKLSLNGHMHYEEKPMVVIAATDGCFGYFTTPMEFEGVILDALLSSDTPAQWEHRLKEYLCSVASDDVTMVLAVYGASDFKRLKKLFTARYRKLCREYLEPISRMEPGDREARYQLWLQYKDNYLRNMEGN